MPKESSAVMRFIDLVQNQPIIEKPLDEPLAFAEPSSTFALPKPHREARADDTTPQPRFPDRAMDTQVVSTLPGETRGGLSKLWYGLGAICFVGLGVGIGLLANSGGSSDAAGAAAKSTTPQAGITAPATQKPAAKPPAPTVAPAPVPGVKDEEETTATAPKMTPEQLKQTGFDIRVNQDGAVVTLDGKEIGKAPLRVRNLKAGAHSIAIAAPAGYVSVTKEFELGVAEAKEVTIELEKVAVKLPATIVASFTSEPPGATVTLYVKDKKLISKVTPIKMKLRTGHDYTAEFSRDGYTTIKKPVEIVDDSELTVAAVLQTNRVAVATKRAKPTKRVATRRNLRRPTRRATRTRTRTATRKAKRRTKKAKTRAGYGTLLIGSKPPCKIYINGRPTGLTTPQRGIKLKSGKHRVSLINRKYKIRRTVTVRIASGKRTRVIRDFSHKLR